MHFYGHPYLDVAGAGFSAGGGCAFGAEPILSAEN